MNLKQISCDSVTSLTKKESHESVKVPFQETRQFYVKWWKNAETNIR